VRRKVRHFCITTTSQIIGAAAAAPAAPLSTPLVCRCYKFCNCLVGHAVTKIRFKTHQKKVIFIFNYNVTAYANFICSIYVEVSAVFFEQVMMKGRDEHLNRVKAILYLRIYILSRYISCVSTLLYQLYVDSLFDSSTEVFQV